MSEDHFTIYLPSNAPGSSHQTQNESSHQAVSSWYKTSLDQDYELEGEWDVGLAEICFPAKLLSVIEQPFKVGVIIMNPLLNWIKEIRTNYVKSFKPGLTRQAYNIAHTHAALDTKYEFTGNEKDSVTAVEWWANNPWPPNIDSHRSPKITREKDTLNKYPPDDEIDDDDDEDVEMSEDDDDDGDVKAAKTKKVIVGGVARGKVSASLQLTRPTEIGDKALQESIPGTPIVGTVTPSARNAAVTTASMQSPGITIPASQESKRVSLKSFGGFKRSMTAIQGLFDAGGTSRSIQTILELLGYYRNGESTAEAGQDSPPTNEKTVDAIEPVNRSTENETANAGPAHFPIGTLMKTDERKDDSKSHTNHKGKKPRDIIELVTTGSHDPKEERFKCLINIDFEKVVYLRPRLFEIASEESLDVEHAKHQGIEVIKEGFYSSRAEMVDAINQRLKTIVLHRSYPGTWADTLVEPMLIASDSGLCKVITGFHDQMNGATCNMMYLTPTISSKAAIKFLGLAEENWVWDENRQTFVFVVAGSKYQRRDSMNPIPYHFERWQKLRTQSSFTFTDQEVRFLLNNWEEVNFEIFYSNFPNDSDYWTAAKLTARYPALKHQQPQFLYIYSDIAAPVNIGNTRASILRITTLKHGSDKQKSHNKPEKFLNIFYGPVSRRRFDNIEIFLTDENGSEIFFDDGSVYIVLDFRRRIPLASALKQLLR